ncbi:MAG: InlB B-repeat-containing protein, partial [Paludibacteraceae bacterium]|nr:InlB B-repeat-containing protein [Paludibacteraceae bacterium]
TEESLTAVTINDVAISATDLASLVSNKYLFLADAYVTAPVVKFTKHTVITYDDASTKEKDEVIEVTSQPETTTWSASATINGNSYYVYTSKAASRTVTYMYGEQVLGTEIVAANGNPAEYAQYETMPLATFGGWYKDAELTQKVESMAAEVISANVTFYAKFSKAYAESIDFEGMVINNGKSYDVKSALDAKYYDYKTIDALDSLNNDKGAARNEPYLGLKIKKKGGYLACNVLPGTTIRIKFGYVAETVLAIAGNDTIELKPTDNKIAALQFPIAVETLVKLQTTSDKTVVIKQIMIDQPIATWMYPITYAPAENGAVSGWTIAFPGEDVTVAIAPEAGYLTHSLTYNGVALHDDENTGAATFTMPSEAVTVAAEFLQEFPTDINNTDAAVKAVKVIRNGQLIIVREGIEYNAQGAIVK